MNLPPLDPAVRRMNAVGRVLKAVGVLPPAEKMVTRPLQKRKIVLPTFVTGKLAAGVAIRDASCPTPDGPVWLRIYDPEGATGVLPGLVYLHGGGWVGGDPRSTDKVCTEIAARSQVRIVSVDYRLAPETPFPGPLDDCLAGLRWVLDHAAELRVDPSRLAVGGDSAGGNLAAALAIRATEVGIPLGLQVLIYPVVDGTLGTDGMKTYAGPGLTPHDMGVFVKCYLGSGDPDTVRDPLFSPLHATSLAGLPPAVVITCGWDPLRDEGRLYAEKLQADGVETELHDYPNAPHGFFSLAGLCKAAMPAIEVVSAAVTRAFHEPATAA